MKKMKDICFGSPTNDLRSHCDPNLEGNGITEEVHQRGRGHFPFPLTFLTSNVTHTKQ